MNKLSHELAKAERLDAIAKRIGFALWQLQTLEEVAATYYVLVAKASQGMGVECGEELLNGALSKTFGTTVKGLEKSEKVPPKLIGRFQKLLAERNWLVHNSRNSSNSAVYEDTACAVLIKRVDAIEDESRALLKEVSKQVETFLLSNGFHSQDISNAEKLAQQQVFGQI